MFCPACGTYAESNYCPNCGNDLRKIQQKRVPQSQVRQKYSAYLRFYPDKLAAIRALRIDTDMQVVEANRIIEELFEGSRKTAKYREEQPPISDREKEEVRRQKAQKVVKTVGKGVGTAAFMAGYAGLHVVTKLVKGYSKRK